MAQKVLIVGSRGMIASETMKHLPPEIAIQSQLRLDVSDLRTVESLIHEAKINDCSSIVLFSWLSNSTGNYDLDPIHLQWMNYAEVLARIAHSSGIHLYLFGTCLDSEPNQSNFYSDSKHALKVKIRDLIDSQSVSWIRPYYVVSSTHSRPRIVKGLLANSQEEFFLNTPLDSNDYILLEDVGVAVAMIIKNELMGSIDVGSGFLTTNLALCEALKISLGLEVSISKRNQFEMREGPKANIERLLSLGWNPENTDDFFCKTSADGSN
jgi:hypothetical protein